jgi:tetratricopeptide (TPR) repeat protein
MKVIEAMEAEPTQVQRHRLHRWGYLLAAVALLIALAILLFPWGASAYHLERAGRALSTREPADTTSRSELATRRLRRALAWDPENAQAYRLLAQAHELRGNQSAKAEALTRYVEKRPKDPWGYWELAVTCERLNSAELALVPGQWCGHNEASHPRALRRLWRLAGQSADGFVRAGDNHRRNGDPTSASTFFERALLLDPEVAGAWLGLGQVHWARGEDEAALEALDREIELGSDPQSVASAHDQRGQILAGLWRWTEASEELAQAVALVPDNGFYHLRYGWYTYRAYGATQVARAELETAASLVPTNPGPWLRLAEISQAEKDFDQMLAYAQHALELNPELALAWILQGRALRYQGQLEEAEQVLRYAVGLAPGNDAAHGELAQVLKRMGRLDEAIAELELAVSLAPNNVWRHLALGNAYRANGQNAQAIEVYRHILEIDPDHPEATQALEEMEP